MRIAIATEASGVAENLRQVVSRARPGIAPHQVAWLARDGAEAVRRCAEDRPDLLLLGLALPGLDGVEATRRIMAQSPCAILLVSAHGGTHTGQIFEAMGAGALDVIASPTAGTVSPEFLAKLDMMARFVGPGPRKKGAERRLPSPNGSARAADRLVAIGSSAGGPPALAQVLGGLPANFAAAVVIVQHLDEKFAPGLVDWLDGQTPLPVRVAREGERPQAGQVLVAGRGDHLVLSASGTLGYTPEPLADLYRPSVDVFFESVAAHWRGEAAGVILTGMGRDGAKGLKRLRNKGWDTVAQDQATSAIYGMPKEAAALGAAKAILPLCEIASALMRWADHKHL